MTDLEMTKLCAEAIGLTPEQREGFVSGPYWPLGDTHKDNADAFALVKRFDIVIEREKDKSFGVTLFGNKHKGGNPIYVVRNQRDLNRAIVECVAKMQAAKARTRYDGR